MDRFDSCFRPDLFAGKTVLVTGGGTGIGRCTAHELASLGATVLIAARREEPLAQTVAEIHAAGGRCETATNSSSGDSPFRFNFSS
jgi:citronellol/citronellal dehydrogenase